MIETALLDGDIICYRCAAVTENENEDLACWQAGEMIRRILHETNAMQYRCFLTGSDNFRYSIYPEYKANRKNIPKPKHLQTIREHLVTQWNATVTDGIEADDAMGIAQCSEYDGTSVIASIDKDMLMIPGHHYNFVKMEHRFISPLEGLRNFYLQLILGDKSDNIPGFDGKMRPKVPQFLQPVVDELELCMSEKEMYELVYAMWEDKDMFMKAAQCLYIQKKENDVWQRPNIELCNESLPTDL